MYTGPTLKQVCAELKDFENWFELGIQLGVNEDILDSIEASHKSTGRKCLEMVQQWLNSKYPTWEGIHDALMNIYESDLAARIADKYDVHPCGTRSSKKLSRKQFRTSTYFATIMDKVTKLLENRVNPKDLVQFLRLCQPQLKETLQDTNSISAIMNVLVPTYINDAETGFLKIIVEHFGCWDAQELLMKYRHYQGSVDAAVQTLETTGK